VHSIKSRVYFSQENDITPIKLPYQDDINIMESQFIDGVAEEVSPGIQHIGFKLHLEEFLLPMSLVREIIMLTTITFVPQASVLVEGIIALRGEIMPVLNLRRFLKFQRGKAETTSRVIILHCPFGGFGVLVDDITEFVWLQSTEIESIPQNFFPLEYKILLGVSRVGNKIRGIIDIDKIVEELVQEINQIGEEGHEDTPH
jgi:purine-binding chemotaxis protein CheW